MDQLDEILNETPVKQERRLSHDQWAGSQMEKSDAPRPPNFWDDPDGFVEAKLAPLRERIAELEAKAKAHA